MRSSSRGYAGGVKTTPARPFLGGFLGGKGGQEARLVHKLSSMVLCGHLCTKLMSDLFNLFNLFLCCGIDLELTTTGKRSSNNSWKSPMARFTVQNSFPQSLAQLVLERFDFPDVNAGRFGFATFNMDSSKTLQGPGTRAPGRRAERGKKGTPQSKASGKDVVFGAEGGNTYLYNGFRIIKKRLLCLTGRGGPKFLCRVEAADLH